MLYREIIAVCSQKHTKHINTLCGQNMTFPNVKLPVYKYIVTTRLYSVKAHTTFDCCSTGHAVSISTLYCIFICIYMQFVLCCALQADTLQCTNCSQQTIAK